MSHSTPTTTREWLYEHVFGGLMAAALGDAMGAATEQHQIDEIVAKHDGLLRELVQPAIDTFSESETAGLITDDTSQMFLLSEALIKTEGKLDYQTWLEAMLWWSQHSPMRRQMGPTTRPLLEAMAAGESTDHIGTVGRSTRKLTTMGATNGAAMRVAPAGLVHPGDIESAVRLAWLTARLTHDTQIAASGAGAIAAGVAAALMPDSDVFSVATAALEGATLGEQIGKEEGRTIAGANVRRRIEIAIEEALKATSLEDALRRIEASVGNSVMMVESAPAAVGIFVAAGGDPLACAIGGTNIGNDTDTIAAMAGAMGGALRGFNALPQDMVTTIQAVNDEDMAAIADGLTTIAWNNLEAR
jgi:ADP-ribosylglycohydrolase